MVVEEWRLSLAVFSLVSHKENCFRSQGPLFFLVYINDIAQGLSKGTVLKLFADDSLLYRIIKSPRDIEILQRDLDLLQNWEKKWKMEFLPR